jgi:uncharacterized membrane protein
MARREDEKKKNEALDELEVEQTSNEMPKHVVEFNSSSLKHKKKQRKRMKKSKSAISASRSQFAKSYIFDAKRDKDKGSVKVIFIFI